LSAHHLLEDGAASDGDNTNAPIEEVDFAVFRLEDTGGDRHKGGTVLVLFFVDGRGARGGFCNGRGLLDEVLEAVDDLDLVLLMMMVRSDLRLIKAHDRKNTYRKPAKSSGRV